MRRIYRRPESLTFGVYNNNKDFISNNKILKKESRANILMIRIVQVEFWFYIRKLTEINFLCIIWFKSNKSKQNKNNKVILWTSAMKLTIYRIGNQILFQR